MLKNALIRRIILMHSNFLKALHFLRKARELLLESDDFQYSCMTETLGRYIETIEEDIEEEQGEEDLC